MAAAARRRGGAVAAQEAGPPEGPAAQQPPASGGGGDLAGYTPVGHGDFAAARQAAAAATAQAVPRRRPARKRASSLLTQELVPEHYRDPYLRGWYRAPSPPGWAGFRRNLASLFRLHNETGNIWTHLLGFLIFIFLTVATVKLSPEPLRLGAEALTRLEHQLLTYGKGNVLELLQTLESWEQRVVQYGQDSLTSLTSLEERLARVGRENLQELLHIVDEIKAAGQSGLSGVGSRIRSVGASAGAELAAAEAAVLEALAAVLQVKWPVARWPIYIFTAGAMVCLLTSATCHLFGCCERHIAALLWKFDYAGIAVLIVASFFPPIYYGFLCSPWTRLFYLVSSSLLGLSTLCVTLLPSFQKNDWQAFRATLFVALGLWGVVPMLHAWALNAGEDAMSYALSLDVLQGAIYIGGAVIYAKRFPEKYFKPGAFDVAFHSHQLFHVAVVVAACVHYKAVRVLLAWRDATGGCLTPLGSASPLLQAAGAAPVI